MQGFCPLVAWTSGGFRLNPSSPNLGQPVVQCVWMYFYFSFYHFSMKFSWSYTSRAPSLLKSNLKYKLINAFCLDFLRCCKSKCRWNLESWVCSSENKKIKHNDYKSHSFTFECRHFMHGFRSSGMDFRICHQSNLTVIDNRFILVIWASINTYKIEILPLFSQ